MNKIETNSEQNFKYSYGLNTFSFSIFRRRQITQHTENKLLLTSTVM